MREVENEPIGHRFDFVKPGVYKHRFFSVAVSRTDVWRVGHLLLRAKSRKNSAEPFGPVARPEPSAIWCHANDDEGGVGREAHGPRCAITARGVWPRVVKRVWSILSERPRRFSSTLVGANGGIRLNSGSRLIIYTSRLFSHRIFPLVATVSELVYRHFLGADLCVISGGACRRFIFMTSSTSWLCLM